MPIETDIRVEEAYSRLAAPPTPPPAWARRPG